MSQKIQSNPNSSAYKFNHKEGTREYQFIIEEKGYCGDLANLGKLAYFKEYFDKETLEEQHIKSIIPLENPTETKSFKSGYELAKVLVKHGFTKNDYVNFLKNINKRLKEKLEKNKVIIKPTR